MPTIDRLETRKAVESIADGFLDQVLYEIVENQVTSFARLLEFIDEQPIDDTHAINLDLDDQVTVLEHHADDFDVTLGEITLDGLRHGIEENTCYVLHCLALAEARETLSALQDFVEENDLALSQTQRTNEFGWAVHSAEREEGDCCQVYEYRGVEGEIDVDVWHYFRDRFEVFFNQYLDAED